MHGTIYAGDLVRDISNQLHLSVWGHIALVRCALMPGWDRTLQAVVPQALAKAGNSCLISSSQTEITTKVKIKPEKKHF